MALVINIKGQYRGLIPNVLSRKYKFTGFEGEELEVQFKDERGRISTKRVNVKTQANAAWTFITERAARYKPCNDYFKTLLKKQTLKEVLADGDITLHRLEPKAGHTYADLPDADTAGRDIAIDPALLFEQTSVLACTLIHEIAHIAGATTDPGAPDAHAAELALKNCLCASQYRPEAVGSIERIGPPRPAGSRIV